MLEQRWPWLMGCTWLWTGAVGLMTAASVSESHMMAGWAVLAAMAGCLPAAKIIVDVAVCRERMCVEQLAEVMAREVVRAASSSAATPIR